jgi:hypothetical protein
MRKERSSPEPKNCHNYTIISVDDFEANLCSLIEKVNQAHRNIGDQHRKISSSRAMGHDV